MEYNETKNSIIADYYALHYKEILAFVSVRITYADEAEDIVQNVFVRLLQMDKMITPTTLPCLVYTVARNLVLDYWRHKQKVEEYEHVICKGDLGFALAQDTESIYSVKEIEALLERGIARLSESQQKVYRLNFYAEKPVREISRELAWEYKRVEHRLGDARKEVRSFMRKMLA